MPRGRKPKKLVRGQIPSGVILRKDLVHLKPVTHKISGENKRVIRIHLPLWVMETYFPKEEKVHPVRLNLYRREDGSAGIEIIPIGDEYSGRPSPILATIKEVRRTK